ncbi:helix-turn-helix domain-containing protein [Phytohabitans rumicis]|uniref:AraC family transcriptional regulator n=1 Tax=Phytohabitans rumicis TaxID=1076125 RepID=A0A6V8KPM2_9ACTN|nr:AraC family transcriptional regulator [Phytohabitans rumicis]GFJ87122.1 AraC family transcriptional regulator [Phytohabitans rumicis]
MEDRIERAVKRTIAIMQENLSEQLSVDDLAREAFFSKFHFTRVFQRTTGVSPGRFLAALRLQEAKHLLVSTSLSIADICMRVGYSSVGTFSSRFTRSIGMPPSDYRRLAGYAPHIATEAAKRSGQPFTARAYGHVWSPEQLLGPIFIGLFPERIPEGRPVRCAVLPSPGPYRFDAVPPGSWYLLAQSLIDEPADLVDPTKRAVAVAAHGPVTIRQGDVIRADVALKPARELDPPVLLALLDARQAALASATDTVTPLPAHVGRPAA